LNCRSGRGRRHNHILRQVRYCRADPDAAAHRNSGAVVMLRRGLMLRAAAGMLVRAVLVPTGLMSMLMRAWIAG
jgi:hypothetical protein